MRFIPSFLVVPVLAGTAVAQAAPEALVLEGDPITGVGNVVRIDNLVINDSGAWIVEADTDNPDLDADSVLLRNGAAILREGDSVPQPNGATIDGFDALTLNQHGDSGVNYFLTTGSTTDDSGIYFNNVLVIQEGSISTASGFSPGTQYLGFFETKLNDDNQILVMASVDDPAITTDTDRAIVLVKVDGNGNLISETVVAKEGDVLPGQSDPVLLFEVDPDSFALSASGDVLAVVQLDADTATDFAIYLGDSLLAQEGGQSPVGGRLYEFLSSRSAQLNDSGNYVFQANLTGDLLTDEIIVHDGSVLVSEGDVLPDSSPYEIEDLNGGGAPVLISNQNDVIWSANWTDPDTSRDEGIFRNHDLIVQEGVTTVNGLVLVGLSRNQDAFQISDDGHWLIFEGTLQGGINGAFRVPLDFVLYRPSPGAAGVSNAFRVENATPGLKVYYAYGLRAGFTNLPGCPGLGVGLANAQLLGTRTANGSGAAVLDLFVPNAASGRTIYLQAAQRGSCRVSNLVIYDFP